MIILKNVNKMINLSFENRLHLNKEAGKLMHAFGDGYFIIDEHGREVNTFAREKEFNRLINSRWEQKKKKCIIVFLFIY